MSTEPETTDLPFVNVHTAAAQELIATVRALRERIPNLVIPTSPDDGRRMARAASVPDQCVVNAASKIANTPPLARNGAPKPEKLLDLSAYALAYVSVADELEGLASLIRHSARAARAEAGNETLTTVALAERLAKRPETAYLLPWVEVMRRALARRRKKAKQAPANDAPVSE